jgi:serine/threonine protein kinase
MSAHRNLGRLRSLCPFLSFFAVCTASILSAASAPNYSAIRSKLETLGYRKATLINSSYQGYTYRALGAENWPEVIKIPFKSSAVKYENRQQNRVFWNAFPQNGARNFLPSRTLVLGECIEALVMPAFTRSPGDPNLALTLHQHQLNEFGRLTHVSREKLVLEIIDAVALIHNANTVHRDLKPPNILIDDWGRAVIIDWAFSAQWGCFPGNFSPHAFTGNLGYCSPNQSSLGAAEFEDDLHSLRTILAWDVYAFGTAFGNDSFIEREFAFDEDSGEMIGRKVRSFAPEFADVKNWGLAAALWSRLPQSIEQLRHLAQDAIVLSESDFARSYGGYMLEFLKTNGFQPNEPYDEADRQMLITFLAYDLLGSRFLISHFPEGLGIPDSLAHEITEAIFQMHRTVLANPNPYAARIGPHKALHFRHFAEKSIAIGGSCFVNLDYAKTTQALDKLVRVGEMPE